MSQARRDRGAAARLSGRRAEWTAALWLMLKGYRILGFRLKTRQGEVDLLALKGQVLAVAEVKSRATLEAALECVTADQRDRLHRAGRPLAGRLDLVALAPRRRSRHILDAWKNEAAGT